MYQVNTALAAGSANILPQGIFYSMSGFTLDIQTRWPLGQATWPLLSVRQDTKRGCSYSKMLPYRESFLLVTCSIKDLGSDIVKQFHFWRAGSTTTPQCALRQPWQPTGAVLGLLLAKSAASLSLYKPDWCVHEPGRWQVAGGRCGASPQ